MKYDFEVTETKTVAREVDLPYYAQDACFFLMITENETVIRVKTGRNVLTNEIEIAEKGQCTYDNLIKQAFTSGTAISEAEFMDQYNTTLNKIRSAVEAAIIDVLP